MATRTVTSNADAGAGSLRDIIDNVAQDGDIIVFDNSVTSITLTSAGLRVTKAVSIVGHHDSDGRPDVTISGNDQFQIIRAETAALTIDGLILRDGNAAVLGQGSGGAIYSQASLTISNSIITENHAISGGGGIAASVNGLTIVNSTVSNNSAGINGGGIETEGAGAITIENVTFSDNTAGWRGGALSARISQVSVTNVTMTGNTGTLGGDAIWASDNVTMNVGSSTIAGNVGGLYGTILVHNGATVQLSNSVVADNDGADLTYFTGTTTGFSSLGGNFIGDANGIALAGAGDQAGTTAAPLDPLLGPLADNGGFVKTMLPLPGSPLIAGGISANLPADTNDIDRDANTSELLPVDARGAARVGDGLDIGAVEITKLIVTTDVDNDPTFASTLTQDMADDGGLSLREAAHWANSGDTIGFADDMTIVLEQEIAIDGKTVTIDGGGKDIVVSGDYSHRIFDFGSNADVTIDGLTLAYADAGSSDGGAIRSMGDLTLRNSEISVSTTLGSGGGLYAAGNTTIINTTFFANDAGVDGGGVFFKNASAGVLTIANSTFEANDSQDRGGGLFFDGAAPGSQLTNVTLFNNHSDYGGGIYKFGGDLTLVNSTIAYNLAWYGAGGIVSRSSASDLTYLKNTVAAGNSGFGDLGLEHGSVNSFMSQGNNFVRDGQGLLTDGINGDHVGTKNFPIEAKLGPLQDNGGPVWTIRPDDDSPLLNAGSATGLPLDPLDLDNDGNKTETLPVDARGAPRQYGIIDIGAFEVASRAPTATGFLIHPEEDSVYVFELDDFGFADADGHQLKAILIDTLPPNGVLKLDGVVLTGPTSVDPALITAGKLIYEPPADFTSSGAGSFTFRAQDDGGTDNGGTDTSATQTVSIKVSAVNDAPTITAPTTIAGAEDTNLTITGISFSDIDADSASVVATLAIDAGKGTLIATSGGGVTVDTSVPNALTFLGTIADINAFIAAGNVVYAPAADLNGNVTLGIAVSDEGFTGDGGVLGATGGTTLAIAPVNDGPGLDLIILVNSIKENADTSHARKVANYAVHDIDGGTNTLSLVGADKNLFVIKSDGVYLKAHAHLDFETNKTLNVGLSLDDATIGTGPESIASWTINVKDVRETITGNYKDNVLTGTGASETIDGKGGDDRINGKGGGDIIRGGPGVDTMTGGGGEDTFVFKPGDLPQLTALDQLLGGLNGRYDLITDFKPGVDVIDLSALDADALKNGNQKFHFEGDAGLTASRGELVYQFYGSKPAAGHTIVLGDTTGDGVFDIRIVLKGHHHLDADDFIL